jgi:hypothetical protein
MWLRDYLPTEIPGARIVTYGHDSSVRDSRSFQDVEAISGTFRENLVPLCKVCFL